MRWLAVLLLVGCHPSAPPVDDRCARDEDCDSVSVDEKCCGMCAPLAATKKSAMERREACKNQSGAPPRCPYLDCPRQTPTIPKCTSGRCTLFAP